MWIPELGVTLGTPLYMEKLFKDKEICLTVLGTVWFPRCGAGKI